MTIKILDCTLRDGGYVNDWNFGGRSITGIIKGLTVAGLDIVECGFLQDEPYREGQALYNSVSEFERVLPAKREHTEYVAMMNSGSFDVSKLRADEADKIFGIRVVFHEHQADAAVEECKIIKEKGYRVFLQPMGTDAYSDKALIELIEKANEFEPYAFYFVDSLGVMNSDDIVRMALLLHNNLKPDIVMGFHSHNNLQLAFSNVQKLINMRLKRELIIDSSTYGMGRGAGNLHTELIANYMNENYETGYNVDQILRVYDEYILRLRKEFTWGYSVPYYLAAIHKCHPGYGIYMVNRGTLPVTDIGVLLSSIPAENKRLYSERIIEDLYFEYVMNKADDTEACEKLGEELRGKVILLLGPGKSLITNTDEINSFIQTNKPVVISVNHVPDMYPVDYAFYSNRKRFEERRRENAAYILTSNIQHNESSAVKVDYMSLCNWQGKFYDNAAVMLLSLLRRIGCNSVSLAGLDGYWGNDYYDNDLQNISDPEWMKNITATVTAAIAQYSQHINISFITPSAYNKGAGADR